MSAAKPFLCEHCDRAFKTDAGRQHHARDVHAMSSAVAVARVADPACMECGEIARLVGGEAIYPHLPDLYHKRFWLCECGAYCGCHGVTTRPLGFPAGPETRRARNNAHAAFDPIWRSRQTDRRGAYTWLAQQMGLAPEDCHIGMMTAEQAWQVFRLCQARIAA